jgi:hypothetical protein
MCGGKMDFVTAVGTGAAEEFQFSDLPVQENFNDDTDKDAVIIREILSEEIITDDIFNDDVFDENDVHYTVREKVLDGRLFDSAAERRVDDGVVEVSPYHLDKSKLSKSEILENLRAKLGASAASSHGNYPFSAVQGGLPRGALIHMTGSQGGGKTEMALRFIAENPQARVAWIEDRFTLYPVSVQQLGADLERVLFIHSGEQSLWTFSQILSSQYFEIIVLSAEKLKLSDTELRRLQLMAEKAGCCCILISENESITTQGDWSVALKLETERVSLNRPPRIHVLKSKTSQGGLIRPMSFV